MNEQLAQEAADYAADYRGAGLKPVPTLCKAVCPSHRRACSLHMDEHAPWGSLPGPTWHQCDCGPAHNFWATVDMYGNPIHTRKEDK